MNAQTLRGLVGLMALLSGLALSYLGAFASANPDQSKRVIGLREARERTETYARVYCERHGRCQGYSAAQCLHHGGGVSCRAHNFIRTLEGKKYRCGRLVFHEGKGGNRERTFLGPWKCHRGWPPGAVGRPV